MRLQIKASKMRFIEEKENGLGKIATPFPAIVTDLVGTANSSRR
jgi:hypothetical protein